MTALLLDAWRYRRAELLQTALLVIAFFAFVLLAGIIGE